MTIASGINTVVAYKKQSSLGTISGETGGKEIRRVSCTLDISKDTYESNEKVKHAQVVDFRHGVRRGGGALDGELSPGTYVDFLGSLLRREFTAGEDTGSIDDVTPNSAGTFTRLAGSFITDGIKIGDVVRWTGFAGANNNNKNFRVTNVTALVLTVAEPVATEAEQDAVTCTVVGRKSWMPTTGLTADAYTFEKWFSDIAQSERFIDVRIASVRISLPATGMATISFGLIAKDASYGTAQYFTTPTAVTTTGLTAAVNGSLRLAGADVAVVTGMEITVDLGVGGDPVVGSNTIPSQFYGRSRVSGQMTAYFEDETLRDLFINETEAALQVVLTTNNEDDADFVSFVMPRVKVGGASKGDGDQGIIQTLPFTALLNVAGGASASTDLTTLAIQDSTAA